MRRIAKTFAIGIAALALSACDSESRTAPDGYKFGPAEYSNPGVDVTFVLHGSFAELSRAAPAETQRAVADAGRVLRGFSLLRGNSCEVHIVDPAADYQPEWIGHEITHCLSGRWHP